MINYKKGQFTPVALMVYVVALVMAFVMLPVIMGVVEDTLVPSVANSTNPNGALIVTLADLVPAVVILAILLSMLNTAIPRQPGY
jgi:hypothetical protein